MPELSSSAWEEFLASFPDAHILQTANWGELKASFGWSVAYVRALNSQACGAQVLFRRLPLGFTLAYIPRGPVGQDWDSLWPEVDALCRRRRAIFLKVEPDCWDFEPQVRSPHGPPPGFQLSQQSIQPPRTLVVSLVGNESELLERMKQKTRYNIRLALKKGVVVSPFNDIGLFSKLMQVTGERDRFGVHSPSYYEKVYDLFYPRGECQMLLAEYKSEPLAALMVFARGKRAWYFYGASSDVHRDRMPSYLLQWGAMRWARLQGCSEYDLWGVPDVEEEVLEANFTKRPDGLWGVYRFKRGFGGELRRAAGPWDRVYLPGMYRLYSMLLKSMGNRESEH
jgi:lipid II:glycine glycyltransferase (peptidoglycan interpeptide bridge formation enzyme)